MKGKKNTIRIKVGDTVKVLRGKDNGKTGKVSQVLIERDMVVVDGVNAMVKHLKSSRSDEKGQRIDFFGPLHVSKVMLICPKCNKPTRVGHQESVGEQGEKQKSRQCKKCNESI